MLDHDKAHRILLSRRKWHRTDCDCSECADHEVLSAYIERCKTLEAENERLKGALEYAEACDVKDDLTPKINETAKQPGYWVVYAEALEIVSNRYSKSSLVHLVTYLLIQLRAALASDGRA